MAKQTSGIDGVVQLLDDPAKFDLIKTNLKTTSSLTDNDKKIYSALWNQFGKAFPGQQGNLSWVVNNHLELIDFIKENYTNGNTLRNKLEGLAHMLLAADKHKFKETARRLFNDTLVMQKKLDRERDESILPDKEIAKFVPYPYLMAKFNELTQYRIANRKDIKLNIYHLLIALNVLIPPLRRNWAQMEVWPPRRKNGRLVHEITSEAMKQEPPENGTNYLWEQAPGDFVIILNTDKVENARKSKGLERQHIRIADDISNVTSGDDLNKWLSLSLEDMPRNYVLIGVKTQDTAMGNTSYDKALAMMFYPRQPTQNVLRKAYDNFWYDQKLTANQKKEIAFRMRHTPSVAMTSYLKVNAPRKISDWDPAKQYPANALTAPPNINLSPINQQFEEEEDAQQEEEKVPAQKPAPEPAQEQEIKEAKSWKTLPAKIPPLSTIKTPPRPSRQPFNYVQYSRDYRLMHTLDINRKQAINYENNKEKILCRQILGRLNKSQTSKPMNKTVEKYMLYQEQPDGPWFSHMFDGE